MRYNGVHFKKGHAASIGVEHYNIFVHTYKRIMNIIITEKITITIAHKNKLFKTYIYYQIILIYGLFSANIDIAESLFILFYIIVIVRFLFH